VKVQNVHGTVVLKTAGWYEFTIVSDDCPDDGGSTDLWNVGELIPVYTALQPVVRTSDPT
jgi:hypothetical protein